MGQQPDFVPVEAGVEKRHGLVPGQLDLDEALERLFVRGMPFQLMCLEHLAQLVFVVFIVDVVTVRQFLAQLTRQTVDADPADLPGQFP